MQRTYYQPVTNYQAETHYEPVTSYRTSYYYEPVTSYTYSSYYDPCSCGCQLVQFPGSASVIPAMSLPASMFLANSICR